MTSISTTRTGTVSRQRLKNELGLTFHENADSLVSACDVVSIHCPLHPETEHMFNDETHLKDEAGFLHC